MQKVQIDPLVGLLAQVAVLAGLTAATGLSEFGWLVGVWCGLITTIALTRGLSRRTVSGLGPADWVTLTRATLVGGIAALIADSFSRPIPVPLLVMLSAVALTLDAVDGGVARRTGTSSTLGARFDMEVDAFLIFVLSIYLARFCGGWVLAIGLARYGFVAAGWFLLWLRQPLPPRYWRKVVAATQGIVLTCAATQLLPRWLTEVALALALALLAESFGRDVEWLWRNRKPGVALISSDQSLAAGRRQHG